MLRVQVRRGHARRRQAAEQLLEVVTPRTNTALISPAEHLCAALALETGAPGGGPVALEIVADEERSRFLVRTGSELEQRQVRGQVGAAYPQAALRSLEWATLPGGDPLQVGPHEQIASYTMALRAGDHLPIRSFNDRDLDADAGAAQADPVLGVLGTMHDLPPGWRAISQLVLLGPAPANWARAYRRLALEHPIEAERHGRNSGSASLSGLVNLVLLAVLAGAGLNVWTAWQREDWGTVVLTTAGTFGAAGLVLAAYLRFGRRELHDPELVQEKLTREACRAELRLAIIAPGHASAPLVQARLDRLAAAYRAFAIAAGNGFVPRPVRGARADLRLLAPFGKGYLLNARAGGLVAPAAGG